MFDHGVELVQHIIIGYTQHAQTRSTQNVLTSRVLHGSARVTAPVHFDDEACGRRVEVDYEAVHRVLSSELDAGCPTTKARPQEPFGKRRFAA